MAPSLSSLQVAQELLRATREADLRREAVRKRGWAKALRGFRPQRLTMELALSRAAEFAAAPSLLRELAEVFLKSAGVPEGGRLEERLAVAAARADLPEPVRVVCQQLAGAALAEPQDAAATAPEEPPAEPAPEQRPSRGRRRARGPEPSA